MLFDKGTYADVMQSVDVLENFAFNSELTYLSVGDSQ
jgi:hypothetical protein